MNSSILKVSGRKQILFCFPRRRFSGQLWIFLLHPLHFHISLRWLLKLILSCRPLLFVSPIFYIIYKVVLHFPFYHFDNQFRIFYLLSLFLDSFFKLYQNNCFRHWSNKLIAFVVLLDMATFKAKVNSLQLLAKCLLEWLSLWQFQRGRKLQKHWISSCCGERLCWKSLRFLGERAWRSAILEPGRSRRSSEPPWLFILMQWSTTVFESFYHVCCGRNHSVTLIDSTRFL